MHLHAPSARAAPRRERGSARTKYAPLLRLASGERYRPLRLEDYLHEDRAPERLAAARDDQPGAGRRSSRCPITPRRRYLDVRGAQPNAHARELPEHRAAARAARGRGRPSTSTSRTSPRPGRVAIEYWLLYLYNDFYDQHEADWEGVTVVLENGAPLGATLLAASGPQMGRVVSLPTTVEHPIVYVARGSHADYPKAGRYSIRVCWTLHGRHCSPAPKRRRRDAAAGPRLGRRRTTSSRSAGRATPASWGSGNYVLGVGLTKDRITDPRRRSEYSNPFAAIP